MMSKQLIAALLTLPLLTACESSSPRQDVGMTTGAVPGGVVGHEVGHASGQTVATAGSAALGAFLGSRLGTYIDPNDQVKTAQVLDTARNREVMTWRNRDTQHRYSVTPTRTYNGPSGPCREFTAIAQLDDGRHRMVHGIACRQWDGTWKPV